MVADCPILPAESAVDDARLAMRSAHTDRVHVVDGAGTLLGVLTDDALRRA